MPKIILAVSGGVDSMVMLNFCKKHYSSGDIIVAHFNHGLRANSDEDADFVRRVASEYSVEFISAKANLDKFSEEFARHKRYEFLQKVAAKYNGAIFTAHHLDDLIETIAINFIRGTGWRGLAVLDQPQIRRPFLEQEMFYEPMDKKAIFEYAAKCGLHFREDQSNSSDQFLRNRVREKLNSIDLSFEQKLEFYNLWQRQRSLRQEIDKLVTEFLPAKVWQRKWFNIGLTNNATSERIEKSPENSPENYPESSSEDCAFFSDEKVAIEILRAGTLRAGISATRPQLLDFLHAIQTYTSGKYFNLPGDRLVKFSKTEFEL